MKIYKTLSSAASNFIKQLMLLIKVGLPKSRPFLALTEY